MKTSRYIASISFLITGALHLTFVFRAAGSDISWIFLFYGAIYLLLGILMLSGNRFSLVLGVIFPLSGILIAPFMLKPSEINFLIGLMSFFDLTALIFSAFLLLRKKKKT